MVFYYMTKELKKINKNEVFLVSFPRSGNWWIRFILANLIIEYEKIGAVSAFEIVRKIIPRDRSSHLEFKHFPKIIKTHMDYCEECINSIYVIRDPRDVMVSKYLFFKYKYRNNESKGKNHVFSEFAKENIKLWCKHVKSWKDKCDIIIKYEDLHNDTFKEVEKILNFLTVDIENTLIREAIIKSSFDNMRRYELLYRKKNKKGVVDSRYFYVRKGAVGDWKEYFGYCDIEFLKNQIEKHKLKDFLGSIGYNIM